MKTQGTKEKRQVLNYEIREVVSRPPVLPMVGATPADINQMLDWNDEGQQVAAVPDRDLLERSYDECYLVQYDEHDHEFQDFKGVVFN